ncbi:hypothetical protein LZ30DRAFT_601586 [Colletotrichum cereale]|nr:hypothetical protein LZ30DRAFT_601586 [Colletotrichum cereale]
MKLSVIISALALAIASAEACANYKTCWCERSNFEYEGRIQDNIAWDESTAKACDGTGAVGYYGKNYQECYKYKTHWPTFISSDAIDNCRWTAKCIAAGATIGYCRDKI